MLEVVFLEVLVIRRKPLSSILAPRWLYGYQVRNLRFMVQEIVGEVVAHISEYTAAKHICRDIPIEPEHDMRHEPKGCCEEEE